MFFLVDAQLPPLLAEALRRMGHQALHVADVGLLAATDRQIWEEAVARNAALVTKDRDFPQLRATREDGPVIVWVRVGNTDNKTLVSQMLQNLSAIQNAAERGETVIEFIAKQA